MITAGEASKLAHQSRLAELEKEMAASERRIQVIKANCEGWIKGAAKDGSQRFRIPIEDLNCSDRQGLLEYFHALGYATEYNREVTTLTISWHDLSKEKEVPNEE